MKLQSNRIKCIANMCTTSKLQNKGWISLFPEHSSDSKEQEEQWIKNFTAMNNFICKLFFI